MDEEKLNNRYQNQPWYVKLWRHRYSLLIPYVAIRIYFFNSWNLPFKHAWDIACGLRDTKTEHWYTTEEVFKKLGCKNDKNL